MVDSFLIVLFNHKLTTEQVRKGNHFIPRPAMQLIWLDAYATSISKPITPVIGVPSSTSASSEHFKNAYSCSTGESSRDSSLASVLDALKRRQIWL